MATTNKTPMTDEQKVKQLREQAKDKTLPQDVRNELLDKAVELEVKAAKKTGLNMAKGGAVVAKAPTKKAPVKLAKGGMAKKKC